MIANDCVEQVTGVVKKKGSCQGSAASKFLTPRILSTLLML